MDEQTDQIAQASTRKEFLTTSLKAGAAVAGVAAGAGTIESVARAARVEARDAAAPVTLNWLVEFTDAPDQKTVTDYIIKPYQQANPNVTVKMQAVSDVNKQLETVFPAGTGPDMWDGAGPSFMPQLIQSGNVLNLEPYAKKYGWRNKLSSFSLQSSLYQGKLYYIPTEFESLHLWYNKTLMQKNGWKIPTTYNQLLDVCAAIKAKGLIPFVTGMSGWLGCWDWWYSYFLNAYLGTKKLYKVLTGQIPWTDPDIVTSFQMMKKLWDLGYIMNKQASAITGTASWAIWGQQKGVFRMEGTWGFSPGLVYANATNFEWGIAPLPIWKPGVDYAPPVGIGEVNAIYVHSKNPDVAADFYDFAFFRNRAQILKWLPKLSSIFLPTLKWQPSDFGSSFDPRLASALISSSKAMAAGTAGYLSWTAWPAKTETYMWSNFENILYGRQSITDYLNQVQKIFQAEKAAGTLPVVPKPAGM